MRKTPSSDGTSHLLLSPMELLEKLAALVPPPRLHLLPYHGVLAPRVRDRDRHRIVPAKPVAEPRGGVCPQRSLSPRIDPDTGRQATKLSASSVEGLANDPQEAA